MITSPSRRLLLSLSLLAPLGCGGDDAAQVPTRDPAPAAPAASPSEPTPAVAPTPAPAPVANGTAIGSAMTSAELARAVLQLKTVADRAGLTATSADGIQFQLVMAPETDAARVAALVTALGSVPTTPVTWPPATPTFAVELLEVRGHSLALHAAPSTRSDVLRVLPDGAFFVGFSGTFAAGPSTREGEGAWVYGHTSSGEAGWMQAAHLAPEEGCVLGHDALAHVLSLRLDDPTLENALYGNLHLYRGGQRKHGTFFVTEGFVATIDRGATCRTPRLDRRIETGTALEELHHARITEQGDTFLALAFEPQNGSDDSEWQFFLPEATEAAMSLSLRSTWTVPTRDRAKVHFGVRRGPANARGYWPFSVQYGRDETTFYTSDGSSFVEVIEDAPAAP